MASGARELSRRGRTPTLRRFSASAASPAVSLLTVLGLWYLLIAAAHGNELVSKNPLDVYRYLFVGSAAGSHLSLLGHQLLTTLRDAGLGYAAGMAVSVLVAAAFVLFPAVEQMFLPVVMVFRTAPIVAMTPLLTLVFGRGLVTVSVVSTIIVFFPTLVNVLFGLRSAAKESLDLMDAYGASRYRTLFSVQAPTAVPAFFVSARVAVPGAIIGALVAEWLATGQGMGYQMLISSTTFDYAGLWSAVVVLTVVSVLLYSAVGLVENAVVARFVPRRSEDASLAR